MLRKATELLNICSNKLEQAPEVQSTETFYAQSFRYSVPFNQSITFLLQMFGNSVALRNMSTLVPILLKTHIFYAISVLIRIFERILIHPINSKNNEEDFFSRFTFHFILCDKQRAKLWITTSRLFRYDYRFSTSSNSCLY